MLDYLTNAIEKCKTEMAQLDQRRHDLQVEIRTLEAARSHALKTTKNELLSSTTSAPTVTVPPKPTTTLTSATMPKRSKHADHWQVVIRSAIERFPEAIKTSDVQEIQRAAGFDPLPQNNIRSHFHKLRSDGLYEEAGWGAVRATQAAADLFGIRLQDVGKPNGQPPFGGSDRETAGRTYEANPAASIHH